MKISEIISRRGFLKGATAAVVSGSTLKLPKDISIENLKELSDLSTKVPLDIWPAMKEIVSKFDLEAVYDTLDSLTDNEDDRTVGDNDPVFDKIKEKFSTDDSVHWVYGLDDWCAEHNMDRIEAVEFLTGKKTIHSQIIDILNKHNISLEEFSELSTSDAYELADEVYGIINKKLSDRAIQSNKNSTTATPNSTLTSVQASKLEALPNFKPLVNILCNQFGLGFENVKIKPVDNSLNLPKPDINLNNIKVDSKDPELTKIPNKKEND